MRPNFANRTIWTGDNLEILRGINSECVDLIYLDPPFKSDRNYSSPTGSEAAGAAFKDTWSLDDADLAWYGEIADREPRAYAAIEAAGVTHSAGMKSYLVMMAVRLLEMHRILKPTGTICVHCDPTANSYLRILLDAVFGPSNLRNEVIWRYGKMSNTSRNFPRNHDTIWRYTKSDDFTFNPIKGAESEYRRRYRRHLSGNRVLYGAVKDSKDKLVLRRIRRVAKNLGRQLRDDDVLFDFDREYKTQSDVIYVSIIKGNSAERLGYPTQKPLGLLTRVVEASSNPGDMVLDPFCGCATTCVAAETLGREWAGIDLSPLAVKLVGRRLGHVRRAVGPISDRQDIPKRTDDGAARDDGKGVPGKPIVYDFSG